MNKKSYNLMKDLECARIDLKKAQKTYDEHLKKLRDLGLTTFEEFFGPYVGKCFKKVFSEAPDAKMYIKILSHRYTNCFKIINVAWYGMCTEDKFLDDFPETYEEISAEEFHCQAVAWFNKQMTQCVQERKP